jgi:ATP-dependent DNA helicase PIF1
LPAKRRASEREATWIIVPEDFLLRVEGDKVAALVSKVYPDFLLNYQDPTYLSSRAIVCPNNATVDDVNNYVLSLVPRDTIQYLSCDVIAKSSENIPDFDVLYPTEFLNSIDANNFPTHKLELKKGAIVMLLRNLNQNKGLCNGTRLFVTQLGQRILHCVTLIGSNVGE